MKFQDLRLIEEVTNRKAWLLPNGKKVATSFTSNDNDSETGGRATTAVFAMRDGYDLGHEDVLDLIDLFNVWDDKPQHEEAIKGYIATLQ